MNAMAASTAPSPVKPSLTNAQLELLGMFDREVPEAVIRDMRRVYTRYLMDIVDQEMDELFDKNGWGEEKIEEWKNGHDRIPYRPE